MACLKCVGLGTCDEYAYLYSKLSYEVIRHTFGITICLIILAHFFASKFQMDFDNVSLKF